MSSNISTSGNSMVYFFFFCNLDIESDQLTKLFLFYNPLLVSPKTFQHHFHIKTVVVGG